MTVNQLLAHAAELLTVEALGMRACRTPEGNGDWTGEPEAKAVHDDMITTAAGLLALVSDMRIYSEKRRNPKPC